MTPLDWEDATRRAFAFQLGRTGPDDTALLVLINGAADPVPFVLPEAPARAWQVLLSSSGTPDIQEGAALAAPPESVVLLASQHGEEGRA